ncbi:MAG: hypothetical protein WC733_10300 [Methylophilus sp.]|jgi:hypothetical protein
MMNINKRTSIYAKLTLLTVLMLTSLAHADDMTTTESMSGVSFVSGGIGESESDLMKNQAKDYPLELVFVQKMKHVEEYIADVNVKIEDAKHNVVLEAVADGPFMFVNLVPGKYYVTTEYKKVAKATRVNVYSKKHQRVVFWWPILGDEESSVQQLEENPNSN